jgi:PadR family transcriptional regulator PadR
VSEDALKLHEGTVYASLMRLLHRRLISTTWGISENNRKARFYTVTRSGRRALTIETNNWNRISGVMARVLGRA